MNLMNEKKNRGKKTARFPTGIHFRATGQMSYTEFVELIWVRNIQVFDDSSSIRRSSTLPIGNRDSFSLNELAWCCRKKMKLRYWNKLSLTISWSMIASSWTKTKWWNTAVQKKKKKKKKKKGSCLQSNKRRQNHSSLFFLQKALFWNTVYVLFVITASKLAQGNGVQTFGAGFLVCPYWACICTAISSSLYTHCLIVNIGDAQFGEQAFRSRPKRRRRKKSWGSWMNSN